MNKYHVMFWLSNGNSYSFYVKAISIEKAGSIAYYTHVALYEPMVGIDEIMVKGV